MKSEPIDKQYAAEDNTVSWSFRYLFSALWNNIGQLIRANLCFILFSIPILTIPTAMMAVNSVCIDSIREKRISVWNTFLLALKTQFSLSLKLLIPLVLVLVSSLYGSSFYFTLSEDNRILCIPGILLAMFAVLAFMMIPYSFLMANITELSVRQILKNAFIMCFLNLKYSMLGSVIALLLVFGQIVFIVRVFPFTLAIGISLVFYFESFFSLYGIQRFVLTETFR